MLKKRDAQQLSTTVIILIVLGLIVLVVLIAIFGKESGKTVKILGSCPIRGGSCVSASECTDGKGLPELCSPDEDNNPRVCCVKLKS